MTEMGKAYGSAENEMGIIEESIEFKINRLRETWIGALQEMIDRGDLGELIDNLTTLSGVLVDLIENLGIIGPIVAGFGLRELVLHFDQVPNFFKGIGNVFKVVRDGAGSIEKVANVVEAVGENAEETTDVIDTLGDALEFISEGSENASDAIETVGDVAKVAGEAAGEAGTEFTGLAGVLVRLSSATGLSAGALLAIGGAVAAVVASIGIMVYEYQKADKELGKLAKSLGTEFKNASNDIDSYKSKIETLRETIEDVDSSIEERKQARENLLAVQDEMIGKYGDEAGAIVTITDAINGEIDALDRLTEAEWRRTKREFNNTDVPGWDAAVRWWNDADDNMDLALKKTRDQTITLHFKRSDLEYIKDLKELYDGEITIFDESESGIYTLSGDLDAIQEKLVKIRNSAENVGASGMFQSWIDQSLDEVEDTLDTYGNIAKQYTLYEDILKTDRRDNFIRYEDLIADYQKTKLAGDEEEAERVLNNLKEEYKNLEVELTKAKVDPSVQEAILQVFRDLSPEVSLEIDKTKLEEDLKSVSEEGITKAQEVVEAIGKFSNQEELFTFDATIEEAPEALKTAYGVIEAVASSAGYEVEQLYNHLVETKELADELPTAMAESAAQYMGGMTSGDFDQYQYNETLRIMSELSEEEQQVWLEAAKKVNDFNEAVKLGDAAVRELKKDSEEVKDSVETWNLESALSRYNIDSSAFEKYLTTFKELNPELAENAELCEQAAVAQYALDQAVEDLRSHLNDYLEDLETLDKSSIEYANSIEALAKDLTGLTGIDFSITDAVNFAADIDNLELLRQVLDGDNEALDALRQQAAAPIIFRIMADAGLDTEGFDTAYNELVDWIANNPDLGTLEAKSFLDKSPFIQACNEVLAAGGETAAALKRMFANLGWDVQYDKKKVLVKLPGSTVKNGHEVGRDSKGNPIYAATQKLEEKEVELITNIHFVDKGKGTRGGGSVSPRVSKPTSSSGSNYRPDQKSTSGGGSGGGGGGKDEADEAKEQAEEFFDYFERRVKVLQDAIDILGAAMEDVNSAAGKNKILDQQRAYYTEQLNGYSQAIDMYQKKANEALAKLPADIAEKIVNGAVEIGQFVGENADEVKQAVDDYTAWADKVKDCKQQLYELREALRQLELQKFNNIVEEFTAQFDIRQENAIDLISAQIDLFETAGQLIGESFYTESRRQTEKQIDLLQREKEKLVAQMNSALDNGVTAGSDEWLEMVGTLANVESQILNCKKAVEEFDNAILALHTEIFERIQNVFSGFADELENLDAVLEDFDVATENGNWSKEGLARLGIASQQYEMAKYQVKQYNAEIEELNKNYLAGRYSVTEYTDRLIELKSAQWDAVQASEAAKDAIVDLNKARIDIQVEGINKEIDAFRDLIDAQKDALDAERDLYEYRRSIEEKSKNIASIQKKLAAMANDDSQKAKAERARLQQQLTEAQDDLADFQYKHGLDVQKEALDKELEQFTDEKNAEIEQLELYLENTEQLMADSFATIKENAAAIGAELSATAQQHGVEISDALITSWQAGENAIASYGAALDSGTSAFIGNLQNVEFKTWELKAQADNTAIGLADMFATRADNLVGEFERATASEAETGAVADALHASLSAALESGYDSSGAVGAMNAIKDAANGAASAARDAASALREMGAVEEESKRIKGTPYEPPTQTWYEYDYSGNYIKKITADSSQDAANKRDAGTYITKIKKHATGLRKADMDELAWTQELGSEAILSPTRSAVLTPIKAGDSVLTKAMTDNLWSWAKMSPEEMFAKQELPQVPMVNNIQNNQSMNFGSMVTINGPVNDSLEMMKTATVAAQREVAAGFKKLNNGLYS